MSSAKPSTRNRLMLPDWLPRSPVWPYVLSMTAHVCLLILFATTMRSCQQAPVGFSDEPTREVGIFVEREGDRVDTQVAGDSNDGATSDNQVESTVTNDQFAPTQATSEQPPAEVNLPKTEPLSAIGIGVNTPQAGTNTQDRPPVTSRGGTRLPGGARGGVPGTAFMGTRDEGMKIVFVIDASGSMFNNNAMEVAKGALMSSVQALDERQQFLIIFYDDEPHEIKLHNESKPTLTVASELNKTLARQKISGIQSGAGTNHLPPLEMALKMNPDVIFFLTDATDPPLWPKDLEKIKTTNAGRVRIHTIQFGLGQELDLESDLGNFLRKLARQNGGTYRYHDVNRLKSFKAGSD